MKIKIQGDIEFKIDKKIAKYGDLAREEER